MDRNPNDSFGNQDAGQSGQSGFGNAGGTTGGQGYSAGAAGDVGSSGGFSSGSGGASTSSFGRESGGSQGGVGSSGQESLADKTKGAMGTAGEKLSTVREKAGNLKSTLADKLEAGAEKLRSQGQSGQFAGATGTSGVAMSDGGQVTDKLATGMQRSAEWLRDADLDNLRDGIETQVKTHPGRTLLIALGLGYVLGKAFRK